MRMTALSLSASRQRPPIERRMAAEEFRNSGARIDARQWAPMAVPRQVCLLATQRHVEVYLSRADQGY